MSKSRQIYFSTATKIQFWTVHVKEYFANLLFGLILSLWLWIPFEEKFWRIKLFGEDMTCPLAKLFLIVFDLWCQGARFLLIIAIIFHMDVLWCNPPTSHSCLPGGKSSSASPKLPGILSKCWRLASSSHFSLFSFGYLRYLASSSDFLFFRICK